MTRRDLARLTSDEKDALILALFDRVAALAAKLAERDAGGGGPHGPAKTPGNSSLPSSRGQKTNKPPCPKRARKKRDGPGVSRRLADALDRVVDCLATSCARCGRAIGSGGQGVRQSYDHIELPPIRPVVTPAGAELRRQTLRWRHQFFVFLTDLEVPATNNAAERALRPSAIFRKVTGGYRSLWDAKAHALIRSVIGTGRLHGHTPYQAIRQALAGQTIFAPQPTT